MNIEEFREYCLAKPYTEECLPFDEDTLVFKVAGKVFALLSISNFAGGVNLKCDPEQAVLLREQHPGILPGYHMHKKHWNTVMPESALPLGLLPQLIDHSYEMVLKGLPKKQRVDLGLA